MEVVKKTRKNTMEQLKEENAANGVFVPGSHAGPCQTMWSAGLKHYVDGWWRTPDGWKFVTRFFPVFVKKNPDTKKSFNCDVKNEGGQYVMATLPARDKLQAYLKSLQIWKDLPSMPDGLYTWIFYTRAASPVQFAATKTWSALEMGTIHLAIATNLQASAVHGAGELRKSGDTYTYNLLSGTFTGDWKKKVGVKGTCTADVLEKYIDDEFKARFSTLNLTKTDKTLITGDLPVTQQEIDTYTKAGWKFSFFPTQKECIDAMGATGGRRTRRGGSGKKPRAKTQRRTDGLSAPQRILRAKQIERIQQAREEDILKHATAITSPRNRDRPGWEHPSEAKQERLSELLNTNDRLLAMGKGRRTRRRL